MNWSLLISNLVWILIRSTLNLNQFVEDWHLYYVENSNPWTLYISPFVKVFDYVHHHFVIFKNKFCTWLVKYIYMFLIFLLSDYKWLCVFISSFSICICLLFIFSCFTAVIRSSSTMLNISSESWHPFLVTDLRRKALVIPSLNIILVLVVLLLFLCWYVVL